jgi:hypothetical protein
MDVSLHDESVSLVDFAPLLIANVLPFVGFVLPDSGVTLHSVYLLYWFELLTLYFVYCGCAFFAQQDRPEENVYNNRWFDSAPSVRLHRELPTVHLKHAGYVVKAALITTVWLLCPAVLILNTFAPNESLLSALFVHPIVLLSVLGIVLAHLTYAHQNYFKPRRYSTVSPDEILQPAFYFMGLFSVLTFGWILTFVIVGAFFLSATSQSITDVVAGAILFGGFPLSKLWLEWIRFRAQHAAEPSGLAAWLVPSSNPSTSPE